MNALSVCLCSHAVVLHEGFSPEVDGAGKCLVCRAGKLLCRRFSWNESDAINQLIAKMEEEK